MGEFEFRGAQAISDKALKALAKERAPEGKRIEIRDANHPGFVVHVNDRGKIRFLTNSRFPGKASTSRRSIGTYGTKTDREAGIFTLADARAEAERWRNQAKAGKDPREEARRIERARQRQQAGTVEKAIEEFIRIKLRNERKGDEVARDIRKEFASRWGNRPLADIERADLIEAIESVRDRDAPYQAYNLLGYARRFFDWAAIKYDLEKTPCDRVRPKHLGLKKTPRKRILSPTELAAFWNAAEGIGYPYGRVFQLLAITGQRLSDIADAKWSEIDQKERLLRIPGERFKSERPHLVPLSDAAVAILRTLPQFKSGDYLFSTTYGKTPVNGFSKSKGRLEKAMLAELRKADAKAKLEPFVLHDLRRVVRSGLASLRIPETVAEMVIGHDKKGLAAVYNQHQYLTEMREALDKWAARITTVVKPAANVVPLSTGVGG